MAAGDDLAEVACFALESLPEPLAFPTDQQVLAALHAGALGRIPEPVLR